MRREILQRFPRRLADPKTSSRYPGAFTPPLPGRRIKLACREELSNGYPGEANPKTVESGRESFASGCRRFPDIVHRTVETMVVAFSTKHAVWTRVARATANYLHDTDQDTARRAGIPEQNTMTHIDTNRALLGVAVVNKRSICR